ncbi:MAG: transcription antitermination factor NusB [Candidatus Levybacteria bacterium RIFCSPHIGHO2_02_FULL_39_36]|nr:MAG: N utilization substance protein B-like protein [Candidatus Levybacteria bacterium GW2011_GWA1_39_11]KKR25326.1 MAG: N utilization substance protein B-like protein [Candidatus Levybacteria bacterium GW2011_GWB1_39_7]KKR27599.1 MAG: N utilization substance protein B-like protein [Microgenomates group bacterium GW2011_GWC1_39_7]KKR50427.1 MAG: N utilization substance protein B-like protein [Candidatus Levybacteria bacterium GW2011_GWA2_40_16]OGH14485.1 MAG: transcription antitermination fa
MKTSRDPRHKVRQNAVRALFAESFIEQGKKNQKIKKIISNLAKIDSVINDIAPEFPIEKINRVDLAILRLGVYEILIDKTQPKKVIIDEAIELAKEFGGEHSAGFINGALGKLIKDISKYEHTKV